MFYLAEVERADHHRHRNGKNITAVANSDWVRFFGVNFGDRIATQLLGRIASCTPDGVS